MLCFSMVFLAFVEFAFISFIGIFVKRLKLNDLVRVTTLRQMTRYTCGLRIAGNLNCTCSIIIAPQLIKATCLAPSSPTVANTDAFIWSRNQQSFSSQQAAELS